MSVGEDIVEECVRMLYEQSGCFEINVDLIQQLAQSLKLDTFVDKDAYTHVFENAGSNEGSKKAEKFQRLSIAGSLILVDIDFLENGEIVRVILSLANVNENTQNAMSFETEADAAAQERSTHESGVEVRLKGPPERFSIINDGSHTAESILLGNLKGKNLGFFPENLRYLANIDRHLATTPHIVEYLGNLGHFLSTIHDLELEGCNDWLYQEGYLSTVGKICVNNTHTNQVGLMAEFWQDFRYVNHEAEATSKGLEFGNKYKLTLDLYDTASTKEEDFLTQISQKTWKLKNTDGVLSDYKIKLSDSILSSLSTSGTKFRLKLLLSHPVVVSTQVLDILGLKQFETKDCELIQVFDEFNKGNDVEIDVTTTCKHPLKFQVTQGLVQNYVTVTSLVLEDAKSFGKMLAILRNFIVLRNILSTLLEQAGSTNGKKVKNNITYNNTALSEEAKLKLRESFKLPDDVTDEELINIQAAADNSGFGVLETNPESLMLDDYMEESAKDLEGLDSSLKDSHVILSFDDVSFTNSDFELLLSIDGRITLDDRVELLNNRFKISNGQIISMNECPPNSSSANEKQYAKQDKFLHGLNMTEDLLQVLEHVYIV